MPMVFLRSMVTGRPGWIVVFWVAVACATGYLAPNLTRLAAEGQANLLGGDGESLGAAAAITACSFASFLFSPLGSLRQLGFALVVGITIDALIVRPLLVPCGHWLMKRHGGWRQRLIPATAGSRLADSAWLEPAAIAP